MDHGKWPFKRSLEGECNGALSLFLSLKSIHNKSVQKLFSYS